MSCSKGINTPIELILEREEKFSEENVIAERMQYRRHFFDINRLPKVVLHEFCQKNNIPNPTYANTRVDRQFYSIITIQDKRYASVFLHKDSRNAQQAAAIVCCYHMGLYEEDFLVSMGCLYHRDDGASASKLELR